jgi:thiamine biosynthesis lipoprotein
MGTGVTLDIPDASSEAIFNEVFKLLSEIDEQFSTYKKDSEVSKYGRGELKKPSHELLAVVEACRYAEKDTGGRFSAWAGGSFDPSGYVKGWAIERCGQLIEKNGFPIYCISVGGDILARGKDWRIGIQDPSRRLEILATLKIRNGAIATSGDYERGGHIIDPATGRPADGLNSVSVVGPSIVKADILATAAFVAGHSALDFIADQPGYEALITGKDGSLTKTSGFDNYLA